MHRTGTTNLQIFLEGNRRALARGGVVYPGEARNHQTLAWAINRGDAGGADALKLIRRAAGWRGKAAILSAEDFFIHRDLTWVREVAGKHDVSVRVYLRRQDDWLNSWYNQHVKWPFSRVKSRMSPAEFLDAIEDFWWLDYEATLGRWAEALGEDKVSVAVVERGGLADVTEDFIAHAGLTMPGLARGEDRSNDSLPVHTLEVARHMGLFKLKGGARYRINEALRRALKDKETGARTVFSVAQRNAVLDRFEAGNAAVARRFLGREALFEQARPDPDEPHFEFPQISQEALLREWIGPVMRELARNR